MFRMTFVVFIISEVLSSIREAMSSLGEPMFSIWFAVLRVIEALHLMSEAMFPVSGRTISTDVVMLQGGQARWLIR